MNSELQAESWTNQKDLYISNPWRTRDKGNEASCHEDVREDGDTAPLVLTPALGAGKWSSSRPTALPPWERAPLYPLEKI
jgi:hypothetical protein